ncbi:MAG: 16S rRNA (adenine(1518)-N(6)/adenine(1519)-N(6))-dimethyltransferase RsmA [Defluviitaleaceae bacterium]|nr:16S rRNA (adenine(1518)-N(6)/adenine(1519)-N(6))-dimethyltransferase RsmA [Defluviitaleaceae bacterium]
MGELKFISTYSKTAQIIKSHGFQVKKSYGQNFLIDQHVVNKIIAGSGVCADDFVIEIGPGIGGLTERLAPLSKHITAVEIDKNLIPILEDNFAGYKNVDILNQDILKTDIEDIIASRGFDSAKIVANLPYYITTPIIMSILEGNAPVKSMTVMIQKEVGQRIKAAAGSKDYGALTLGVTYRAKAEFIANVPRNSFIPRPNVDSVVIRLDVLEKPPVKVDCEKLMFMIIKAAFEQRRKTLINCLFNLLDLGLSKEELAALLEKCGLNPNVRGENLTLEDFARLTNAISIRACRNR